MATFDTTFWARTDSNSANNPAINLKGISGPNGLPAIQITFQPTSGGGGDLTLDPNGGSADPDTVVVIGTQTYNFIFEFAGTLPSNNSSVPDQFEPVPPDPGALVYVVTVIGYPSTGQTTRLFFLPEEDPSAAIMNSFGTGAIRLQNVDPVNPPPPVCFVKGTVVETATGPSKVEDLKLGDLLCGQDGSVVPVVWAASTTKSWPGSAETHRPIHIRAGAIDNGVPSADLAVSPQHHILVSGPIVRQMFGEDEVLAPAKGLTGLPGVRVMQGKKSVEYYHVMLERHEIIMAHGVATESFYPGPTAVRMLTPAQRVSLYAAVPALKDDPENGYGPTARKKITRRQAEELVRAMLAERKAKAVAAE